eukprot:m.240510 g.240510  ORF g.240510 m.240510 type:complete len:195 (+) comp23433_c0_seq1:26-610(+)
MTARLIEVESTASKLVRPDCATLVAQARSEKETLPEALASVEKWTKWVQQVCAQHNVLQSDFSLSTTVEPRASTFLVVSTVTVTFASIPDATTVHATLLARCTDRFLVEPLALFCSSENLDRAMLEVSQAAAAAGQRKAATMSSQCTMLLGALRSLHEHTQQGAAHSGPGVQLVSTVKAAWDMHVASSFDQPHD